MASETDPPTQLEPEEKQPPPSPQSHADEDEREETSPPLQPIKSLEQNVSLPREILVVILISLVQFTTQTGLGSVIAITHVIGRHFSITDPGVLSWLTAGYSLTVGTFILVSGRLGDVFGWKRMMIIGYVWYATWSVVLGLSVFSNDVLFIFARVLQGIGPSICLPNGLALLGALYEPGPRKNLAFAIFGGCAPAGGVTGYVFAGLFALGWWPWTFWSAGIVLAVIAVVAAWAIPDPQPNKPNLRGKPFLEIAWELDFFGAVIGVTALICFNFAWNQAPIDGWASAYIIVVLIIGVVLIPVFFYIEIKLARSPLLPFDVFTTDNAFVLACVACGWADFGIWFYYLVQILQTIRHTPILLEGAYISPLVISGLIAAIASGKLLSIVRPAWIMVGSLCAFLSGTILVSTLPPFQIYWAQIFVTSAITCWGMDTLFASATIVISNSVDKEHQGIAASLVATIVNYSISLGLGFAGTIEVHVNNGGKTEAELLHGYRSALWFGVALCALGLCIALTFLAKSYWEDHKSRRQVDVDGKDDVEKR